VDLVFLPISEVGEYCPFVKPVDPVVEQHDLDVRVAAHQVDDVIAADRERVAVAGDEPHRKLGVRDLDFPVATAGARP
jgi:hypothetical protein